MIATGELVVPAARFAAVPGHRDITRQGRLVFHPLDMDTEYQPEYRVVAVVRLYLVVADVIVLRSHGG